MNLEVNEQTGMVLHEEDGEIAGLAEKRMHVCGHDRPHEGFGHTFGNGRPEAMQWLFRHRPNEVDGRPSCGKGPDGESLAT